MLITTKDDNKTIEKVNHLPWILAIGNDGAPLDWIDFEDAAYYEAKGKIAYSFGTSEITLRGGTNAKTGQQSRLIFDTIIAIESDKAPKKQRRLTPTLSNETLFERDRYLCAYCGAKYKRKELTRDHVIPSSRGGKDTWENCVTACYGCNHYKEDRTPEEADMPLLFVPYAPNFWEHMILRNRNILADQMEYLLKGVPKNSRLLKTH